MFSGRTSSSVQAERKQKYSNPWSREWMRRRRRTFTPDGEKVAQEGGIVGGRGFSYRKGGPSTRTTMVRRRREQYVQSGISKGGS